MPGSERLGEQAARNRAAQRVGVLRLTERARSRLYQNEILQENMRLTAFFKL